MSYFIQFGGKYQVQVIVTRSLAVLDHVRSVMRDIVAAVIPMLQMAIVRQMQLMQFQQQNIDALKNTMF